VPAWGHAALRPRRAGTARQVPPGRRGGTAVRLDGRSRLVYPRPTAGEGGLRGG